jgi:hypothetical protein
VAQLTTDDPALTDAQLVAVDFARAMMSDPAGIPAELRVRLHRHWSAEQIVELALDVMKWSYQKVAVALGVDREVVPGRLTELVFDENGEWVRPTTPTTSVQRE